MRRVGNRVASLWRRLVHLQNSQLRVGKLIAEGGFSHVYMAYDHSTREWKALKRIRIQSAEQRRAAEHEREVHAELTRLAHPNLLPLLDWGRSEGEFMLCYPLRRDGSLREEINLRVLRASGTSSAWSTLELLEVFAGVCRGVQALHDHDPPWAHRDIKPENVLMGPGGEPQLMDFGSVCPGAVAVRSRAEALLLMDQAAEHSTMSYRAPELFDVPSVPFFIDSRTDVWSLGCVLFALLYGYSPFECEFTPYSTRGPVVVDCT
eukprot:CAMPEP_0172598418 /NCGR_PEP_ID=MMETSP1068-20121228/18458_1 /TAXON_ID=35684 /ORGANISM="Pseudopedinella elastica, Strain CCMP716" /LENGTH=262 /DNA_ID=CAMNT_0013398285 /DNA_START=60 /DNA_END=848 /DNA_ORIENTATION=+